MYQTEVKLSPGCCSRTPCGPCIPGLHKKETTLSELMTVSGSSPFDSSRISFITLYWFSRYLDQMLYSISCLVNLSKEPGKTQYPPLLPTCYAATHCTELGWFFWIFYIFLFLWFLCCSTLNIFKCFLFCFGVFMFTCCQNNFFLGGGHNKDLNCVQNSTQWSTWRSRNSV